MKTFFVGAVALLVSGAALAQEMRPPNVTSASVDWNSVRSSVSVPDGLAPKLASVKFGSEVERRINAEANQLGILNRAIGTIFPNVAVSPVPVLLPLDTARFLSDFVGQPNGPKATSAYLAGVSQSKFFLPGPAGYDAMFLLGTANVTALNDLQYKGDVEIQMSGSSVLYELAAPALPAGDAVALLAGKFPGIRRVMHENLLRYTFVLHGAPYFVSLQCDKERSPTATILSCGEASRVAEYFLNALHVVGGSPSLTARPPVATAIERPGRKSPDFTYVAPGNLIAGSGYRRAPGNQDRTVYARMRFPIAETPAYANSQEFMNLGQCAGTGRDPAPEPTRKNQPYRCTVNDRLLMYYEGDSENYHYPWRDNFCESRDSEVGQCARGHGHQGQDIRPARCFENPANDAKCAPYRHTTVAVRDGYVVRSKENEALYLVVNAPNEHIRFRYLHMLPKRMNDAGMIFNKQLKQGDKIGEVGNFYDKIEGNTTYHLHFDIQVPTRDGWVWVSPYMTLVAAYERAIGGRGTELPDYSYPARNNP